MTDNDVDLSALRAWFAGRIKKESPRELQARRALLWMLRDSDLDGLEGGLRRLLIEAIDPDGDSAVQLCLQRKRGRPHKANPYQIAAFVHREFKKLGEFDSVVKRAMTKFKASHGTVTAAWSEWGPVVELDCKMFRRA